MLQAYNCTMYMYMCMYVHVHVLYRPVHVSVCPYYFSRLEFGKGPPAEPSGPPTVTNDILAMLSPEQEKVQLQKVTLE